ncbi:MAG: hypothetical protein KA810_13975, partial [Pyrinomonadaceae bacterium]|nr:hypothetical protein [Pyrinomonadaceae bacterium]
CSSLIPAAGAEYSGTSLLDRGIGGGRKAFGKHLLFVGQLIPPLHFSGGASRAHFFAGTVHLVQF